MAVRHGYGKIAGADALVFAYDTGDTRNSYKGEPTVNYVPGTYAYSLYAYASGPVNTTVLNENNKSITAKRYTITNTVNTARAAIFPTGLTTGVAYTFSFKWKYNGTTTTSPSIGVSAYKGNPETNNNGFSSETQDTVSIGNGWYLTTYTFVFSSNPTGACMLTFGINTGSNTSYLGETFDIYEAQFEIKDHRTPFVNGTRSATQGLLDLTGNTSIDLTNAGFNSNAEIDLDGTSGYLETPISSLFNLNAKNFSIETVFYGDPSLDSANKYTGIVTLIDAANSDRMFIGGLRSALTGLAGLYTVNDGIAGFITDAYSGYTYGSYDYTYPGKYTHLVYMTDYTNTTQRLYINGELYATKSSNTFTNTDCRIRIGRNEVNEYLNGKVDVVKFYNRALTADEVRNNYRHYKTRFNI